MRVIYDLNHCAYKTVLQDITVNEVPCDIVTVCMTVSIILV